MTKNTTAPELLPCPFCGGKAKWISGGPGCTYISCMACPAATDDGAVPRIAKAWNTRADLHAARVAELEIALSEMRRDRDVRKQSAYEYKSHTRAAEGACIKLEAERDAARADVARLRDALRAADGHIDRGHYEMARNITRSASAGSTPHCSDCPPEGYPTDNTRCAPCPRRLREVRRDQ
ncbi:Lar family restriction alleviation protein [Roseicitreum antarcticum]|uniref:Restriction alleviation protein Lar n=1 Tax=Roseicitreum antarcticum TaxID=564137 RepID=A0A1H3G104_9RHOB|nr:Lar family restriction alleviation protein [Roseicitreum antarcticum]SDX96775.1 Restriction alleviation protein Lar [Roseicitreum antarcticum]